MICHFTIAGLMASRGHYVDSVDGSFDLFSPSSSNLLTINQVIPISAGQFLVLQPKVSLHVPTSSLEFMVLLGPPWDGFTVPKSSH